ncbi:hypothetical protein SAMN06298216_1855 [Spirosomataceae bacterium TFI 002]|nr:hypothetical protein SAMN06298216_1855 [Spirosomataceae bacterium TFI 002]
MKITQEIWAKSDTVLFIFAGAAAEFSLNKAVDWLYFTGKLPADPLGRLFSTVEYAQRILFLDEKASQKAIQQIAQIHKGVEKSRGAAIPDWAYRDVLYMLVYYSIASFELLERQLTEAQKEEVLQEFLKVGHGMGLQKLPINYQEWCIAREAHLSQNLEHSKFTSDLYLQYRMHLGWFRHTLLLEIQKLLVPKLVHRKLALGSFTFLKIAVPLYKLIRRFRLSIILKNAMMPSKYSTQIQNLNIT